MRAGQSLRLDDIPGVSAALNFAEIEEMAGREDAWMELKFTAGGFKLRPMTVRDYAVLLRIQSPLLFRAEPSVEELVMFVWLLSPQFYAWVNESGWRQWSWLQPLEAFLFARKARKKFAANAPESTEPVVKECLKYIAAMFYDSPPALAGGRASNSHFITEWMDTLRSEYQCTADEVWAMPLPQLFALLKSMARRHGNNTPDFSAKRDAVTRKVLRALRNGATMDDLKNARVRINFDE